MKKQKFFQDSFVYYFCGFIQTRTIVNNISGAITKNIKISVSLNIKRNISNIKLRDPKTVINSNMFLLLGLFRFLNLIFNISINKNIDKIIEINEHINNTL